MHEDVLEWSRSDLILPKAPLAKTWNHSLAYLYFLLPCFFGLKTTHDINSRADGRIEIELVALRLAKRDNTC